MFLNNYKIKDLVTEQLNTYLIDDSASFSYLKNLIVAKLPIPQVHSSIVKTLTKAKISDRMEILKILEKQACNAQLIEDQNQKNEDLVEQLKDEKLQRRLTQELNNIPKQQKNYSNETAVLKLRLNQLFETMPKANVTPHHEPDIIIHPNDFNDTTDNIVHQHFPDEITHQHTSIKPVQSGTQGKVIHPHVTDLLLNRYNEHVRNMQQLRLQIREYEIKIQTLESQKRTIETELNQIEIRSRKRFKSNTERLARENARSRYLATGGEIGETLSSKNNYLLSEKIKKEHTLLEKKCIQLIKESEEIHYLFFINQLSDLPNTTKKLKDAEIFALNSILKLMNRHLKLEEEMVSANENLNKKIRAINSQFIKLDELSNKLDSLKKENPELEMEKQKLTESNLEISKSFEYNNKLYQRLTGSSFLLFALTLLFSIPLILTLNGVIAPVINPVFLYILVSVPPALLLIATVAIGIAAAINSYNIYSNESEIKQNKQTIENNTNKMHQNNVNKLELMTTIIPKLEASIKKNELTRNTLVNFLKHSTLLSQQILKQASEIEPLLSTNIPFIEEQTQRQNNETNDPESLFSSVEKTSQTNGATLC